MEKTIAHPVDEQADAGFADQPARGIDRLLSVMARLRDPDTGCPWDLAQRAETIVPHTIEEAYEVAEAIESGNDASQLDELGDLLFQVVFYAQLASETGRFNFDMIADAHADKMISRHPHVFGTKNKSVSSDVSTIWEDKKDLERAQKAKMAGQGAPSVLDGITKNLPGATQAMKLQKRAARVGFDWPSIDLVVDKVDEELSELKEILTDVNVDGEQKSQRLEDELGDVLFAVVNVARHCGIDPEKAFRHANRKFDYRFRKVEQAIENNGKSVKDASLVEMEAEWERAKAG